MPDSPAFNLPIGEAWGAPAPVVRPAFPVQFRVAAGRGKAVVLAFDDFQGIHDALETQVAENGDAFHSAPLSYGYLLWLLEYILNYDAG